MLDVGLACAEKVGEREACAGRAEEKPQLLRGKDECWDFWRMTTKVAGTRIPMLVLKQKRSVRNEQHRVFPGSPKAAGGVFSHRAVEGDFTRCIRTNGQ